MSLPPDPPRLIKTIIFTLKTVQAYQTISKDLNILTAIFIVTANVLPAAAGRALLGVDFVFVPSSFYF